MALRYPSCVTAFWTERFCFLDKGRVDLMERICTRTVRADKPAQGDVYGHYLGAELHLTLLFGW